METLPQNLKDRLFVAAIEIMEYSQLLESENKVKKWGWLFHTYVQWHAIAYILREICMRPHGPLVERAWRAVDGVFNDWGDAVKHSKSQKNGMLWLPMRKLMAKARRKREADMQAFAMYGSRPQAQPGIIRIPTSMEMLPTGSTLIAEELYNNVDLVRPLQQGLPLDSQFSDPTPPVDFSRGMLDSMTALQQQSQQQSQQSQASSSRSQSQLQAQFQQFGHMPQNTPWLLDDSALVDLDMNAVDGDVSWEGWDDLVRDFQMEVDPSVPDARGPAITGMGNWW